MEKEIEERTVAEMAGRYLVLLWHWAWLLILLTIVAGAASYFLARRQTPIYQASTLILINSAPANQSDTYSSLVTSQQLAQTYAQVMTTRPVLDAVAAKLGVKEITASIDAQPITSTQLLKITVEDTDPDRAALIANTLVSVFSDQLRVDQAARYADSKKNLEAQMADLEKQIASTSASLAALGSGEANQSQQVQLDTALAQYRQSYALLLQSYEQIRLAEAQSSSGIIQKEPAVPASGPIRPQPLRSAILAAFVGLFLGVGIVILSEVLDDTLRDPQEITRKWGIPVLGMIVSFNSNNGNALITVSQPRSPVSEAFRSLRTNLQFASLTKPVHSLLITSPSPGDGKTTVVANLASVIAQGGRKVVVLDADLRRPRIHKLLQLSNRKGLTDEFLQSRVHLDGIAQPTQQKNFMAITSGSLPPNPAELLDSERMNEVLHELKNQYDMVILDTPPSLVVTDANALAPRVDGVLLVIRPNTTKRMALTQVIEQLTQVKANILGVVLNGIDVKRSRNYYYRGYYYHRGGRGYKYASKEDEPATEMEMEPVVANGDGKK